MSIQSQHIHSAVHTEYSPLVHINKIRVLSIRQIIKGRCIKHELIFISTVPNCLTHFLLLLVLLDESVPEDKEQQELNDVRCQQGANAHGICGCLTREVEERTDDVTDAGAKPDHAGHDHLLGLATDIRGD